MTNIEFKVADGYREGMIQLPKRMTSGSNGYDFYACSTLLVPSHNEEPVFVPTGVTASFDPDTVLLLFNRSSNPAKRGLVLANGVGVVDSDYYQAEHNDIQGMFYNFSNKDYVIHSGDRIMQGVFTKTLVASNGGTSTNTREGGFGSTDEGNHSKVVQDLLKAHREGLGQKVRVHGVLSKEDLRDLEGLGYLVNHDFNLDEDTYNNFWLSKLDTSGTAYRANVAKLLDAYAFGEGCADYELTDTSSVLHHLPAADVQQLHELGYKVIYKNSISYTMVYLDTDD